MATQQKFYLLDATTTNTGTMPSNSPAVVHGGPVGTGTEAPTASTARATSDIPGTSNPDIETTWTAQASSTAPDQILGVRRFVTPPLAARTFASGDGAWTFSCGQFESNTNHNMLLTVVIYCWRPSTGARVGAGTQNCLISLAEPGTTETASSNTAAWQAGGANNVTILDGDILVFDLADTFRQGMATAYTGTFCYDGTTEASTTTNAAFINAPVALTLFTGPAATSLLIPTTVPTNRLM